MPNSVSDLIGLMSEQDYICDPDLALVIYLSLKMEKPLFLEGEAGVGKTELAKALSKGLDRTLIRLQCYEGLDVNSSLYEWNYAKQLLQIKLQEVRTECATDLKDVFGPDFLIKRPLLQSIESGAEGRPVVLLIDELDRADEEFEAFLLELLSDFQVSIPEVGTMRAKTIPAVVITSNRTREIHDATKRRCLYHWIDYPSMEKERDILKAKIPGIGDGLTRQICRFMQRLRQADFLKTPGVAEALDWGEALMILHRDRLDQQTVIETKGFLFKHRRDLEQLQEECSSFLAEL